MVTVKVPRSQSLPGMEDRKIAELQNKAVEYAEIRDQRMALTGMEVDLKTELLALMKKFGKERYVYDGVEITVVHEEESVKVKLTKQDDAKETAAGN